MGASWDSPGSTNDYVQMAAFSATKNLTSFSISMWVYWNGSVQNATALSSHRTPNGATNGTYYLYLTSSEYRLTLRGDSNAYISIDSDTNASTLTPADQWHNICYTWTQPATYVLYIDGSVVGSNTGASSGTVSNLYSGASVNDKRYFTLDGSNYNSDMKICYEQMFDRVLSADEVVEIMNKPSSVANGLISYTPMLSDPPIDRILGITGTVNGNPAADLEGPPVSFPQMIGS